MGTAAERSVRTEENIILIQGATVASLTKSTRRLSLETNTLQSPMVWDYLNDKFGKRGIGKSGPLPWPVHVPDLTPSDFWLWDVVKDQIYASKPRNLDDLKYRITHIIPEIPTQIARRTLQAIMDRFRKYSENGGCQIETL
ncbi:hypothetical protein Trydic_g1439 [Trypoxylus dichotomus]